MSTIRNITGACLLLTCASFAMAPAVARAGVNQWSSVGGPEGGYFSVIVNDPSDPAIVYGTGGSAHALWRSADGGASWSLMRLDGTEIQSLAIDPLQPDTMYAIASGGPAGFLKTDLIKSVDRGLTWAPLHVGFEPGGGLSALRHGLGVAATSPATIYAIGRNLQENPSDPADCSICLYRSGDGGSSWTQLTLYRAPFDENVRLADHADGPLRYREERLLRRWGRVQEYGRRRELGAGARSRLPPVARQRPGRRPARQPDRVRNGQRSQLSRAAGDQEHGRG